MPALPRISAVRVTDAIRIDGRLDEAAWAGAPVATGFTQIDPHFGQPATEQTEVRVLYDDEAIYLGARMFDSDPSKIRARLGRRDESLSNADLIEFYLDSYHNRVDGYLFRVTPAGAVRDAVVLAGGGQDNSWDAVWESSARVDSLGWVAELRIPFSQLRFSAVDGAQTWGLQVARIVARKNEGSHLAYTPPHMAGGPQRWGTLEGLRDLPRARHIEVLPYVT
ncbi:MAG TPA: carbohydrate binding family 9 domain-containing protein, partial [Gemmatimonadaceae bacterium]|nr:carbohydrate binding family 9 domain-containing protein [Gemmatimonadaceae bacterium]